VNAKVAFDPQNEHQRPGLALVNGVVYIAWASHEDHDPYHAGSSDITQQPWRRPLVPYSTRLPTMWDGPLLARRHLDGGVPRQRIAAATSIS